MNSVRHLLIFGVCAANGLWEVWGEPKLKKIAAPTLPKWRKLLHQRIEKPYFTEKLRVSSLLFSFFSSLLFSSLLFFSLLFSPRLFSSFLLASSLLFSSLLFFASLLFASPLSLRFFRLHRRIEKPASPKNWKTCFREMSKNVMCLGYLLFSSLPFSFFLFSSLLFSSLLFSN